MTACSPRSRRPLSALITADVGYDGLDHDDGSEGRFRGGKWESPEQLGANVLLVQDN